MLRIGKRYIDAYGFSDQGIIARVNGKNGHYSYENTSIRTLLERAERKQSSTENRALKHFFLNIELKLIYITLLFDLFRIRVKGTFEKIFGSKEN